MTDSPKKLSQRLMIKNHLNSKPNLKTLAKLIADSGFTIIEYNKYSNAADVTSLIEELQLQDQIATENSFVYAKGNVKFVFINSDLKESDKVILLRHELGHIYDRHLCEATHLYSKIEREDYANEFAHYLGHPTLMTRIVSTFLSRKLACILIFVLLIASSAAVFVGHNVYVVETFLNHSSNSILESYYVTTTGEKYHKSTCKHVKYKTNTTQTTITEAISQGYAPCHDCIGE